MTYLKNSPFPYYPDLTIEYTITHFKLSPLDYSLMHSYYDTYPYRNKQWPIGKYYGKHYNPPLDGDVIFDFLQSQGGISFELQSSYWKIVSLFPDSKTPFLNNSNMFSKIGTLLFQVNSRVIFLFTLRTMAKQPKTKRGHARTVFFLSCRL